MRTRLSDVSIRDLEIFMMASRTRSVREAARQLGLLPAHTSKIIKALETKLGVSLFRRSVSGIMLTPEGLNILQTAEKMCELAGEMIPETTQRQSPQKLWTIGSIGFLSTYFLTPAVCQLQRTSKKPLRFRLLEFTHNDLVAHGLKGAFEMALHIEKLEWTHAWESYSIGFLKWKLYGNKNHPLNSGCKENQVIKFPFIVPTDWDTNGYSIGEDFCPLSVRRRLKGNEAATAETALELCRHSEQLTFVPEILAQNWCDSGKMKAIHVADWPIQEKEIFLSVRADVVSLTLAQNLLKTLRVEQFMALK